MLYQLSKNVDSYFFRMFISELEKDMKDENDEPDQATLTNQIRKERSKIPSDSRSHSRRSSKNLFLRPDPSAPTLHPPSFMDPEKHPDIIEDDRWSGDSTLHFKTKEMNPIAEEKHGVQNV